MRREAKRAKKSKKGERGHFLPFLLLFAPFASSSSLKNRSSDCQEKAGDNDFTKALPEGRIIGILR